MTTSSLVSSYLALTPSSPRSDLLAVLQQVINARIDAFTVEDKETLVQAFIDDVKDGKGRVGQKDIPLALEALKVLGRNPTASRVIIKRPNLQILYNIGTDTKEQNAEAAQEALRSCANALLLIEAARDTWLDIHGGEACVEMLERTTSPHSIFLAARLLFLVTAKQTPFIRKLVEELRITDILGQKFDLLMNALLGGQAMAKESMIDLLKFAFNLLLQYPRMLDTNGDVNGKGKGKEDPSSSNAKGINEQWNESLGNLLPSLLRLFNGLPPTFPSPLSAPLTHVIHALINIPVAPFANRWFSPVCSPVSTPRSNTSDKLHKAFSAIASGRRSLSSSRSSSPAPSPVVPPRDTVQRAWDLLEISTAHYIPGDPDDPSVRQLCRTEGVALDDTLTPLVALLARLAGGDESARLRMKEWILPADLDRTSPLEARQDLLGRCLRIMSCVYFPHVKDTIGELLFTICDSDASILAGQVGYGNCAGFLFNKGIMAPPAGVTDSQGETINPITGIRHAQARRADHLDEMTEEEKEREAEKLFVLFERLEKSGMGVNPIRKAQQEGRLEEVP
ncbi:guanine nucleotide exchange factor [Hysterangium stoloniferum]|nr:guanine nucleotide exchange factor [Hysterangium stoloniferum]